MKRSKASPSRLSETLKYCSSRKKEIYQDLDIRGWNVETDLLLHLSTMTFIANQLGFNLSYKLSKIKESSELLGRQL